VPSPALEVDLSDEEDDVQNPQLDTISVSSNSEETNVRGFALWKLNSL
jgi:hypothetical protein